MTLTEFLNKENVVLSVDVAALPDGVGVSEFVEIISVFEVIKQNTPPIVIKDTAENRDIMKGQYD